MHSVQVNRSRPESSVVSYTRWEGERLGGDRKGFLGSYLIAPSRPKHVKSPVLRLGAILGNPNPIQITESPEVPHNRSNFLLGFNIQWQVRTSVRTKLAAFF